ncbi:MAG: hypothetical protein N2439_02360 [Anaerolineae bacterium]|nr:hypothetical protein [Anaerolineae bacterium]
MVLWATLAVAQPGAAAERLTIRLVQATNEGQGASDGLRDVAPLLERNLPFRRFELLESRTIRLPAADTLVFGAGLSVRCEGDDERLALLVRSGDAVLLQTQVRLTGQTPLILGGFPAPGGRRLLVLTAR